MRTTQRLIFTSLLVGGGVLTAFHPTGADAATTRYVCQSSGGPPGCYPTIQSAIDASQTGDRIIVPGRTYNENLQIPGAGTATQLTILGSGAIVDGTAPGMTQTASILTVSSASTVYISGFTFTKGNYSGNGGGVLNHGTLTLFNDHVTNNSAAYGGGIYNDGTLHLTNTPVDDNLATSLGGGGIANVPSNLPTMNSISTAAISRFQLQSVTAAPVSNPCGVPPPNTTLGTATLLNSPVSGNEGFVGGGILGAYGTVSLQNSAVSDNLAEIAGGIGDICGTVQMLNSNVTENGAFADAGGIGTAYGTLTITNGVISKNVVITGGSSSGFGGGIGVLGSQVTLTNLRVTQNTVPTTGDGGGVYINGDETCSTLIKSNTAITGNTPDDCS